MLPLNTFRSLANAFGVLISVYGLVACHDGTKSSANPPAHRIDAANAPSKNATVSDSSSMVPLPPLQPGNPRKESTLAVEQERREAQHLIETMSRESGIAPRDLASMADIRGFRLLRTRRFRRALVWFDAAIKTDPSYEPSLLNAARASVLLGDLPAAARYAMKLQRIDTPLARRSIVTITIHHDFSALRRAAAPSGSRL